MKVSLIVATGTHQGKAIPITRAEFLIGREGFCHLRPASQAISKKHCGILLRDGKVFVIDYASTNGTLVNDVLLKNEEAEVLDGAKVSIGPLDFTVQIEQEEAATTDGTPFPAAPAIAAVKAVSGIASPSAARDSTPNPSAKPKGSFGVKDAGALSDSKEAAALKASGGSKPAAKALPPAPAAKPTAPPPPPAPKPSTKISAASPPEGDSDDIAAMLLGMDDDEEVPGGSTVMEIPAMLAPPPPTTAPKPDDKSPKKAQTREDMTNAANDILRKMMRRPK